MGSGRGGLILNIYLLYYKFLVVGPLLGNLNLKLAKSCLYFLFLSRSQYNLNTFYFPCLTTPAPLLATFLLLTHHIRAFKRALTSPKPWLYDPCSKISTGLSNSIGQLTQKVRTTAESVPAKALVRETNIRSCWIGIKCAWWKWSRSLSHLRSLFTILLSNSTAFCWPLCKS